MMWKPTTMLFLLQLFILLVTPAIRATFACKCKQPTVSKALNSTTSSIFTGTVIRKKKSLDRDIKLVAAVVSVDRVIKGCSLDLSARIIVTTAISSAACGVNLIVNGTYFFSGEIEQLNDDILQQTYGLSFNTYPINSTVHVSSCRFNVLRRKVLSAH